MLRKITALLLCFCMLLCISACSVEETSSQTSKYNTTVLVWVPTKVGRKYHKNSYCSNMKNPIKVTKEEAIKNGFGPCKNCY